ncbi:TrbC/VirB2 family protein [Fusobacterium periodonticum]|uniref:TrbC/VirB2 family protein n=1 Tax=Fusobacterium periodonticum TaxID=860 RepID=UPI0028D553A4|nr:TrbC/VirB2 family protein [Fusobacterium periodonticum]
MKNKIKVILFGMLVALSSNALATGGGGMVWEKPATSISKSISGPMAGVVALVVIIVAALTWAMTDGGNMMGKSIKIVVAFAIVGSAAVFINSLFGIATGGGMML